MTGINPLRERIQLGKILPLKRSNSSKIKAGFHSGEPGCGCELSG